jgi:hypothetical protein
VGALDDPAERDADRLADAIEGGGHEASVGAPPGPALVRRCGAIPSAACPCHGGGDHEPAVARSPANGASHGHALAGGGPAPASVASMVGGGGGRPLEPGLRDTLEARLGTDLGPVRLHTDARAAASAAAIGAKAYTLGSDVVFGAGQYAPHTGSGLRTLAHELAHVVQQRAAGPAKRPSQPVRRTSQVKFKAGKGKKARKMTVVVGGVEFTRNAMADVLKSGGLLPGPDQAHIAFARNKLAYDVAYTTPQDPFRWNQIKELIDSDEKIKVDKVDLTDNVKVKFVTAKATTIVDQMMLSTSAAGLTLPTESRMREIYPNETTLTCSPHADMHQIYYTAIMSSSAARSELAHELLGHMWLALKKVPFVHPSDPKQVKAKGTLGASHGIRDPLGATFAGTVEDYIAKFVSSQTFAAFASPTQFVSPALFTQSLADFKAEFEKSAVKKADGSWSASDKAGLAWEMLSNNYRFADPVAAAVAPSAAPSTTPGPTPGTGSADAGTPPAGTVPPPPSTAPAVLTQGAVVAELVRWQGSLSADQKYVLGRMLDDVIGSIDRVSDLAKALRKAIKP